MPVYQAPQRDIRFVVHELLDLPSHYQQLQGCEPLERETLDAIVEEGAKFAEDVLSPLNPVGEYGMSALGRERMFGYFSRTLGIPVAIIRLNYAVDLRYGTLVDIARKVFAEEPVDLTIGWFNAIWQGDANSYALRSLELCDSPPAVLNVTGAERISTRECAEWFGRFFGKAPRFVSEEGKLALLSDATRCRALLGEPRVPLPVLRQWVAHWVRDGGSTLNKPTHFEVSDGRF